MVQNKHVLIRGARTPQMDKAPSPRLVFKSLAPHTKPGTQKFNELINKVIRMRLAHHTTLGGPAHKSVQAGDGPSCTSLKHGATWMVTYLFLLWTGQHVVFLRPELRFPQRASGLEIIFIIYLNLRTLSSYSPGDCRWRHISLPGCQRFWVLVAS